MGGFTTVALRPTTIADREYGGVFCTDDRYLYHLQLDLVNHGSATPTTRYQFHQFASGDWGALSGPLHLPQDPIVVEESRSGSYRYFNAAYAWCINGLLFVAGFCSEIPWRVAGDPLEARWTMTGAITYPLLRVWDPNSGIWTDYQDVYDVGCWAPPLAIGNSVVYVSEAGTAGKFYFIGRTVTPFDIDSLAFEAALPVTPYLPLHYWSVDEIGTYFGSIGWAAHLALSKFHLGAITSGGNGRVTEYTLPGIGTVVASPGAECGGAEYPYGLFAGPSSAYASPLTWSNMASATWSWKHPGYVLRAGLVDRVANNGTYEDFVLLQKTLEATQNLGNPPRVSNAAVGSCFNVYVHDNDDIYVLNRDTIFRYSPSGDTTSPVVSWDTPNAPTTLGGLATVKALVSDNVAIDFVSFYVGAQFVARVDLTDDDGTAKLVTSHVNTTLFVDGAYTFRVIATDTSGNTASASLAITINNTSPPADTENPVVAVVTPSNAAEVAGDTTVTAECTDNQALDYAEVRVDGALQGSAYELSNALSGTPQWTVPFGEWGNGTHVVSVTVYDASGNWATASIQVIVNNLAATTALDLFIGPEPLDAARWHLGSMRALRQMIVVQTGEIPTDPRQLFNVYLAFETSPSAFGTAPAFASMTLLPEGLSAAVPADAAFIRWCLHAVPQFRTASWTEETEEAFFRLLPTSDDDVFYLVARTPVAVWKYDHGTLSLIAELAATTVADATLVGDKIYLATELGLFYYDLDVGQLSAVIRFDQANTATTAVQQRSDGSLLVAQGGKLYSFTFDATTLLAPTVPTGFVAEMTGGVIVAGDADGETNNIYRLDNGSWTLVGTIGGASATCFLEETVGNVIRGWYGTTSSIFTDVPSFQRDVDLGAGNRVNRMVLWHGALWAVGELDGIWRRADDGSWACFDTLDSFATIWDARVVGDYLWLLGEDTNGYARLEALFVDEGGAFQCGVVPPDVFPSILNYVEPEVQ